MRFWRSIPAFCAILFLFAAQCRAQCLVVPHQTEQQAPECPLHKSKAPAEAKCNHAPQWDVDQERGFDCVMPESGAAMEITISPRPDLRTVVPIAFSPTPPLPLRL